MIAPYRLELGNIERGENGAQRLHAGTAGLAAGAGRGLDRVARVEQDGAALLHIGVDVFECLPRWLWRARHDRPIDQGIERKLVARGVETDRLARLERGALGEEQGEALQPGLADAVDLGVAGDDVGEPRLERGSQGLLVGARRTRGTLALREGLRRGEQRRGKNCERKRRRRRPLPPQELSDSAGEQECDEGIERQQRERSEQYGPA